MHNRQLTRHGQHGALARRIRELRGRRADQGNDARRVDDAAATLLVPPQRQHRVLAAKPHALDVDAVRQVPDLLGRVDGVRVVRVHDARVVEDDVQPAPGVDALDHGLHVGFARDVALDRLEAGSVWHGGFGARDGGLERFFGDVGHEHGGAFAGEQDAGLEANAAAVG